MNPAYGIANPYLDEIRAIEEELRGMDASDAALAWAERRLDLVTRYAFSVPVPETLAEIARLSPLVEIGAGSGYWAWCLHRLGADILAFDIRPPGTSPPWDWPGANAWFDDTWYSVMEGDACTAGDHPDRALFLCWPEPGRPMAREALMSYAEAGGRALVFVGGRGSSADDGFFEALDSLDIRVRRPHRGWPGVEEELVVAFLRGGTDAGGGHIGHAHAR